MNSKKQLIPSRIRDARISREMSMTDLAELLDLSKQAISQYELGTYTPTPAVLMKISQTLNYPIDYFYKDLPINNASTSAVFFRSRKTTTMKARNAVKIKIGIFKEITDYLSEFIDFPSINLPDYVYPESVEVLTIDEIEEFALSLRKFWGLGLGPIPNLINVVQKNGIMVSEAKLNQKKIDGLSVWYDGIPYIFIGTDKESNSRIRFSIAHELGHLLLHSKLFMDEELDKRVIDDKLEYEANKFASAFLMPRETFSQEVYSTSIDHFIQLKRKWYSSISSMIMRCEDLKLFNENQIKYLKNQMSKNRYWQREPLDSVIPIEKPFACKQAIRLVIDNNIVSKSELCNAICLRPEEIEEYCFLEPGTLKEAPPRDAIKLKSSFQVIK